MANTQKRHNRLRVLREQKGWSQTELAALVGVNQCMISLYESGDTLPRMGTLFRLTELLGCTMEDLYPRNGA